MAVLRTSNPGGVHVCFVPKGDVVELQVLSGETYLTRLLLDRKGLTMLILEAREALDAIKERN